jgi:hypothetical protein
LQIGRQRGFEQINCNGVWAATKKRNNTKQKKKNGNGFLVTTKKKKKHPVRIGFKPSPTLAFVQLSIF